MFDRDMDGINKNPRSYIRNWKLFSDPQTLAVYILALYSS